MNKSSGHELALNLRCKRIAFVYTYTYKTSAILLKRMCLNITSPVLAARGRKRTRAVRVTRHMQNPHRFPNIWRSCLIYPKERQGSSSNQSQARGGDGGGYDFCYTGVPCEAIQNETELTTTVHIPHEACRLPTKQRMQCLSNHHKINFESQTSRCFPAGHAEL